MQTLAPAAVSPCSSRVRTGPFAATREGNTSVMPRPPRQLPGVRSWQRCPSLTTAATAHCLSLGRHWLSSSMAWRDCVTASRSIRAESSPEPAPDVLGLALRLEAVGTQHDLLLASTGMRPGWRHVLFPRRHALGAPYGSLLPYDAAGRRVLLAAVPEAEAPCGVSDADMTSALATGSHTFRLMVATLRGNWTPFARLTVARDDNDVLDVPVAFDPILNPLPGLPLAQPFRSLREPAYHAARRARQDQAT
jgi:hypothetical protein